MAGDHEIAGIAEAQADYARGDVKKYESSSDDGNGSGKVDIRTTTVATGAARGDDYPDEHQRSTLTRVPGGINIKIFTIALVEFCERFSYYGFQVVLTNFIQRPLPPGSTTGAIKGLDWNTPGALNRGQQASFGITTFNTFWIYVTPILGAYIADTYWGRYKTICVAIAIAIVGHVILIIGALPTLLVNNQNAAYGITILAIVVMGVGTGAFKSNISPLIAEQTPDKQLRVTTNKKGQSVIVDPALTVARIMMYFYLLINLGSLAGQIGMVYAEQDVGFWLSYTIPTVVLCLTPLVMIWGRKRYVRVAPAGSVLPNAFRLLRLALSKASKGPGGTIANIRSDQFWQKVKPSAVAAETGETPKWMTFDDQWVEEVRRGFKACSVFVLIPLFWVCYNQMTSNLTVQAGTMQRNVPNDLINNLNPISLVIMIPIFDQVIYPGLRKRGIKFTPIKRMTCGFFFASAAMVVSAIIQHFIYVEHPCGDQAASCDSVAPISVWVQTPEYVLIGISEIFTSITGLEYAFNKAPPNMRSLVTSMWLFTNAFSAALGQALVPLAEDPLLVINYGVFAGLSFVGGIAFWFLFRDLDAQESQLNDIRRHDDGRPFDEAHHISDSYKSAGQAPAPSAPAALEEKRAV